MQRLDGVKEKRDHYSGQEHHDGQKHHTVAEHGGGWDLEPSSGGVSGEGPWPA